MKFDIVYADCPWKYNSRANHKTRFRGGAEGHYNLMTMKDILDLDVKSIVSDNALLFLWCTFPYLKEQIEVFKAWGFEYKTVGFTWLKTNLKNNNPFFGVGYYTKSNAEVCLLGTRGKVLKPIVNTVSSALVHPRMKHSKKPPIVRDLIDKMYPTQTKLELFARENCVGWASTGLDLDGRDVRDFINDLS